MAYENQLPGFNFNVEESKSTAAGPLRTRDERRSCASLRMLGEIVWAASWFSLDDAVADKRVAGRSANSRRHRFGAVQTARCTLSMCAASVAANAASAPVFSELLSGTDYIVSKRLGSAYRSGRSKQWVKVKNPTAPAVRREAEEDWGR
jgi:hypothetical protein